jgi:hypothetical protein
MKTLEKTDYVKKMDLLEKADNFSLVGRILFGDIWQTDLASALKVSASHVNKIAHGVYAVPKWIQDDLRSIVRDRIVDVSAALQVEDEAVNAKVRERSSAPGIRRMFPIPADLVALRVASKILELE